MGYRKTGLEVLAPLHAYCRRLLHTTCHYRFLRSPTVGSRLWPWMLVSIALGMTRRGLPSIAAARHRISGPEAVHVSRLGFWWCHSLMDGPTAAAVVCCCSTALISLSL
ncbi:hypothetical protein L1987_03865 [Smallanthus sonchifolius]|uniref:Uncharacterized protein n=1 Tax=Smallanthus sonchifolius TaxID=185202 RepID=A0ACB9KBV4_9ASTR|nr:hypothetical protein L1987_03865 [Smallanthus sonchifolius]